MESMVISYTSEDLSIIDPNAIQFYLNPLNALIEWSLNSEKYVVQSLSDYHCTL